QRGLEPMVGQLVSSIRRQTVIDVLVTDVAVEEGQAKGTGTATVEELAGDDKFCRICRAPIGAGRCAPVIEIERCVDPIWVAGADQAVGLPGRDIDLEGKI